MYRLHTDSGIREGTLRGKLKRTLDSPVLVGDLVTYQVHEGGAVTIEGVEPRSSLLQRRTPGKRRSARPVAANLDQVVVVASTRSPAWDYHLTDRFVAVAAANALPVILVVSKCDLVHDVTEYGTPYRSAGYRVVETSVPQRRGLAALRECLEHRVTLFAGSTGVGKSSLLNALQPGLRLRTGEISERAQSGRHTTVQAEMHPFGVSSFVVDTPGLRDVGLWGLEPNDVVAAFPEIQEAGVHCRFDDCRHVKEPDCAVARAVMEGSIAPTRLSSYRKLLQEAVDAAKRIEGR